MSKYINVNPDHYKVAGRERQGDDIDAKAERAKLAKSAERGRADNTKRKTAKRKP